MQLTEILLSPDIKYCLESSNIPPTDIDSWLFYIIGQTEKNAAPKLLICSTDLTTRKNIRKLIKDSKIMERYPVIGLGVAPVLPDRHVVRKLSREAIEAILPPLCNTDGAVLAYEPEPMPRKWIFIVNPHDLSLQKATAGPIILHDGKCYQLTAAHAFPHTRGLNSSSDQQIAEDDCDFDGMSDADESQYDEMTRKGSAAPGEIDSDKSSFMASLEAASDEKHSISESSTNDIRLSVDSSGDNPSSDEIDVSQLQYFGRLFSSPLTKTNPSLDDALLETSKTVESSEKSFTSIRALFLTAPLALSIGKIGSDDIDIIATTSRQGRIEGKLTATPFYSRLPEQRTFQQYYPVRLTEPLKRGYCGTPVFGKYNNHFYGHIVSGSPETPIAYIVPAEQILRHIQACFGLS
ncbi:hypothetical protein ACHAO7_011156 [Fusarium culmorum]